MCLIEKRLRNIVVSGYGSQIGKEGKLIYIEDDKRKRKFSPKELEQLIVFGEGKITAGAVRYLKREGVDIIFVDERHNQYLRIIEANQNPINDIWILQIELSEKDRLKLARDVIEASIYNKLRLLNQFGIKDKGLEEWKRKAKHTRKKDELRGIEGQSSRLYFAKIREIIPEKYEFEGRKKSPPPDPVNSMLSYGYTVLNSRIHYSLLRAGLNPYIGLLHESYREQAALTYDLIEPFRSVIVDRTVLTILNQRMLGDEDFKQIDSSTCYIQGGGKKMFLDRLYSRMESEHCYEGEKQEFLDIMFLQAEKLSKNIREKSEFKAFRWR